MSNHKGYALLNMVWARSKRYGLQSHSNEHEIKVKPPRWHGEAPHSYSIVSHLSRRKFNKLIWLLLGLFAISTVTCLFWISPRFNPSTNHHRPQTSHMQTTHAETILPGERKLVLILPVDTPSHDLCKVISSAVALGYPAPVLVNWKTDFHTEDEGIGPSHLGKVTGTLDFLNWATGISAEHADHLDEDDIVMMMDAHDVWLQLPPQVLLARYYRAIHDANSRLVRDAGFSDSNIMRQTILASAQKRCFAPRDPISDLHCDRLPESTLDPDVYGFWTDSSLFGWSFLRPRYVNSGSFIGPAGDLKRYFQRVQQKMNHHLRTMFDDQELAGDQGVFSETFAEQEMWRQRLIKEHAAGVESGESQTMLLQETFEYHVGLDYRQDLFYPTCYAEGDGSFLNLSNSHDVEGMSKRRGVNPTRVLGVPDDIKAVKGPLFDLRGIEETKFTWGEVPLYTDLWTTAVPVAVHHNAWKDGLKKRRVTWWALTWYFPYLRQLIAANSIPTRDPSPIAVLPANEGSLKIKAYDASRDRRTALIFEKEAYGGRGLRQAEWEAVCRNENRPSEEEHRWFDELFRDGKGGIP